MKDYINAQPDAAAASVTTDGGTRPIEPRDAHEARDAGSDPHAASLSRPVQEELRKVMPQTVADWLEIIAEKPGDAGAGRAVHAADEAGPARWNATSGRVSVIEGNSSQLTGSAFTADEIANALPNANERKSRPEVAIHLAIHLGSDEHSDDASLAESASPSNSPTAP